MKKKEIRCTEEHCKCSKRGKLLLTLINAPKSLFESGAVVQVACPLKKSRLIQISL